MLTLRVMGGFALLDRAGAAIPGLTQRRAEAVLALVALAGEVGCSRDRLIALLWPDADEEHARHNLRSTLHAIRVAVGAPILAATSDQVRLNGAEVSSDVSRFSRALAEGRLADAVAAYGGALLDGFHVDAAPEFERFVEEERARLYRLCAEAIESLAREGDRGADVQQRAYWWMRAVEHDPHNSRVARQLMRALVDAGDPANALIQADLHRRRLRQDLEIEPDDEFEVEVRRIRALGANHQGHVSREPKGRGAGSVGAPELAPVAIDATSAGGDVPESPDASPRERPAVATQVPTGRRHWRWLIGVAVTLVIGGVAVETWRAWSIRTSAPLDPDCIAVAPFSSHGHAALDALAAEAHAAVLRELADGPAPTACRELTTETDGATARATLATDLLVRDSVAARRAGASLVLRGQVDSTAAGTVLTLTLARFPAHRVEARRAVALAAGDAEAGVRRLLLEVLALEAGEPVHRLAILARHRPEVVRRYLEAVRRRRTSRECEAMARAVRAQDSTFVYPALACLAPSGYTYAGASILDTLARTVWALRGGLPREDSAYVNALVGPWFGLADNAEERLLLWERAAEAAPDWWVPWQALAREWDFFGPRTTHREFRRSAQFANERALALSQWRQLGPVEMAFWRGVVDRDSVLALRAIAASARFDVVEPQRVMKGTNYFWFGWHTWPAIYDAVFGGTARVRPAALSVDSLFGSFYMMRILTLIHPDLAAISDSLALRLADVEQTRNNGFEATFLAAHWEVRGDFERYAKWRAVIDRPISDNAWPEYDPVMDAAMDGVWERLAHRAPQNAAFSRRLRLLTHIFEGDSQPRPPIGSRGVAACWVTRWRLGQGDTTGSEAAVALLRALDARDRAGLQDGLPGSGRWVRCASMLAAHRARVLRRGALEAARAYDHLLQPFPLPRRHWWSFIGTNAHDGVAPFGESLEAAQLLAEAGDTAAALAAVRRRPVDVPMMLVFHFTTTQHLRLEARLAAARGEYEPAMRAYERYLALRSVRPTYLPWAAEWDSVQVEYARLQKLHP